jgi:hypothetical protein
VEAVEVGGVKAAVHAGMDTAVESLALAGVVGAPGVVVSAGTT